MKIKIEMDPSLEEEEILIRCSEITPQIQSLSELLSKKVQERSHLSFFRDGSEYYLPLVDILFFETDNNEILAHTRRQIFYTNYRLYELESLLPGNFMRVSKSCILNTDLVYSITRDLSASSAVSFIDTHKQVYVSRHYYRPLKFKLEEKRNQYEAR